MIGGFSWSSESSTVWLYPVPLFFLVKCCPVASTVSKIRVFLVAEGGWCVEAPFLIMFLLLDFCGEHSEVFEVKINGLTYMLG